MFQHTLRGIDARGEWLVGRCETAQRVLQHVNAGAAVRGIDHQADAAAGREDAGQGAQTFGGIREVMQHAAAIDVVERAEAGLRKIEQGARLPLQREVARVGTGAGDATRGFGSIEPGDGAGAILGGELLRQHYGAVARAASGEEGAQSVLRPTSSEQPVFDLAEMARAADDQPFGLVTGVARRIGERLV